MANSKNKPLDDALVDTLASASPAEVRYWRSLQEREELRSGKPNPDEFAPGAAQPPAGSVDRRGFLGILGATAALAGAVACDRTKGRGLAVPYTRRPPEAGIPGVAMHYASSFQEGRRAYSVLVKTREGRPIHITGNDEHPAKAATSPRAIAEVLGLYDPDRLRQPKLDGRSIPWKEAEDHLIQGLSSVKTKPTLLLTGAQVSPTRIALIGELKHAWPDLEHVAWEPSLGGQEAAFRKVLGGSFVPMPDLSKAEVILSLGSDFLNGEDPSAIQAFAKRRLPSEKMPSNRLWVLESALSLTGSRADQRFPVSPSQIAGLAFALAKELGASGVPDTQTSVLPAKAWNALTKDLRKAGSRAIVLVGDQQPAEVHAAAALINATLRSEALTYRAVHPIATAEELQALEKKLEDGTYGTVILWGVNPVYAWPRAEAFRRALAKVPFKVFVGTHEDETALQCQLRLAESHWLESWGDCEDGRVIALQQPTIGTLYDTRQGEDVLLTILRGLGVHAPADAHAYLKARWERDLKPAGASFEPFFQQALHDGLILQPAAQAEPKLSQTALRELTKPHPKAEVEGLELVLHPSRTVFDGRHANNSWLQELPDPITKGTWGNPLSVSPHEAQSLGLKDGDRVELSLDGQTLKLPVVIQPGQAKGTLALALGYGRTTGNVGAGIGVNAYPLTEGFTFLRSGARITRLRGHLDLPVTQGHHRLEGRDLVKSITLAQLSRMPEKPEQEHPTLYPPHENGEHRWGMVIDTASCVGCSACVLACQSENNTPVVGPEQVSKGREMHWIRIDRYYEGDEANPGVVHQPMMCQQCGHAPCENVCPVNATTHSPDGLNQMTYNRCVGTRYCANNCPYKVRRFNFLEFTAYKKEPESLVYNPEVTVRPRGVMEKCTFCVQRIQDGRLRAKGENRPLRDGEIQPACAVSCPSQAITFGDLKDPDSRVSQMARSGRGYQVLDELGVRPAITYLADFRNPALGAHSTQGDGHES